MSNELQKVDIHQSLNRPTLLMGGDRELVIAVFGLALTIAMVTSLVGAGLLVLIVVPLLRKMANADPQMRDVYLRHIQYRAFYEARGGTGVEAPKAKGWQD